MMFFIDLSVLPLKKVGPRSVAARHANGTLTEGHLLLSPSSSKSLERNET